jgi:hypothetical protein
MIDCRYQRLSPTCKMAACHAANVTVPAGGDIDIPRLADFRRSSHIEMVGSKPHARLGSGLSSLVTLWHFRGIPKYGNSAYLRGSVCLCKKPLKMGWFRAITLRRSFCLVAIHVFSDTHLHAIRAASWRQRQHGDGNAVAGRRPIPAASERTFDDHLVAQSAPHGCGRQ